MNEMGNPHKILSFFCLTDCWCRDRALIGILKTANFMQKKYNLFQRDKTRPSTMVD